MKFKELYNKVRREQEVSLDEASMWDAIESRLEKPKKKRRFLWLWFIIGLLIVSGYIFIDQKSESISYPHKLSNKNTSENINLVNTQVLATPSELDNSAIKSNPGEQSVPNFIKEKPRNGIASSTNLDNNTSRITPNLKNENVMETDKNRLDRSINNLKEADKIVDDISTKQNFPKKTSIAYFDKKSGDLGENEYNEHLDLLPLLSFSKLIWSNSNLLFDPRINLVLMSNNQTPKVKSHSENIRRMEFAMTLDYLLPKSNVQEKDPSQITWGSLHKNSKSSTASFQLSAILKYRFSFGLGLGTGIQTRQVSEWYDATVETFTPIELTSDSAKFVVIEGFQEFTSGVLTGTRIERTNYHTPVRRLYFDIPLELSYNRSWNNTNVEFSISYNFNITHQYYGRSFSDSKILLDQDQINSEGIYKSRLVNSANVGLKLNRHLTSSLSMGLSFNYWKQLSSSLNKQSSLNENYIGLGIGVNIKKNFGR